MYKETVITPFLQLKRSKETEKLNEVMKITGLSRITFYRQIKKGVLPAKKFGKQWFIKKETLNKVFE